jgi:hypothetical protein
MNCLLLPALLAPVALPTPDVRGQYVEARTCDVYTGACFANADTGLIGKHAVLAWKVDAGCFGGATLDGLGVVAVVEARETLGLKQTVPGKAILIVDERATRAQRDALVALAKAQAGDLFAEVLAVRTAPFDLTICPCDKDSCAVLNAGAVRLSTRCLDTDHDKACGNEETMYPPLARGVSARAALAVEHCFRDDALNQSWKDVNRRGAFVGSFSCFSTR